MKSRSTSKVESDPGRERLSVVTRKGQITVPAEIRRALGLRRGDKVVFLLKKDHVRLERAGSVVARTAGILKSEGGPSTARKLREAAEEAIAADSVERAGA